MKAPGSLVVIEGPDGVGKSELASHFLLHIKNSGVPAELKTFPGKEPGTLGKLVYEVHHDPARFDIASVGPASVQLLHIAAHVDAIQRQILPALLLGTTIVMDRFWWSTLVYGLARGADRALLEQMIGVEKLAWGSVRPDILFLIDRHAPLRAEPGDLWSAWKRYYWELFTTESTQYPCQRVQNEGTIEQAVRVMQDVWRAPERS